MAPHAPDAVTPLSLVGELLATASGAAVREGAVAGAQRSGVRSIPARVRCRPAGACSCTRASGTRSTVEPACAGQRADVMRLFLTRDLPAPVAAW